MRLSWADVGVGFDSDDPADVRWLTDFLRPWFEDDPSSSAGPSVEVVHDPIEHDRLARLSAETAVEATPCFALERDVVTLPAWRDGTALVVADAFLRSFYVVRPNRVRVVTRPGELRARFAALRIVRELTRVGRSATAWTSLHAASVELDGSGALLVGPKGAGKTTLLAYLLATARGRFVANDWSCLGYGPAVAHAVVRGMPTVVRIRPGGEQWVPALGPSIYGPRSFLHRPGDDDPATASPEPGIAPTGEAHESPAAFAARWDAGCRGAAPLRVVFFPERGEVGPTAMVRLSAPETAQRLLASRYGGPDGGAAATVFGRPAPIEVETTLRRLASAVPAYRVQLRPTAYADDALAQRIATIARAWAGETVS